MRRCYVDFKVIPRALLAPEPVAHDPNRVAVWTIAPTNTYGFDGTSRAVLAVALFAPQYLAFQLVVARFARDLKNLPEGKGAGPPGRPQTVRAFETQGTCRVRVHVL